MPVAAPAKKGGCLKWAIIGFAALVVISVIAVIAIAAAGNKVATDLSKASTNVTVDPSRPDAQKKDHVAALGGSVEFAGYTATVSSAAFQQNVSQFETAGYLVADAIVQNRDAQSQSFNLFNFRLQTPDGQVIDPTFSSLPGQMESGALVSGGRASGKVVWKVGNTKGDYFVIYKPKPYDASRGLWKVTV